LPILISTGDKDIAQIVGERITLVNTMTDSRLDRAGVKTKFDVWPEQIMDYLALIGDSIDNIPGIDKVGPKKDRLRELYTRLEFRQLLRAIDGGTTPGTAPVPPPAIESAVAGARPAT